MQPSTPTGAETMNAEQKVKGTCRHFNGIQHECCRASVRYHDLADGPGCALRWPCLPHPNANHSRFPLVQCAQRSPWTAEEEAANNAEMNLRVDAFMKAMPAAKADARTKGFGKRKGGEGSLNCPVCTNGTLYYTVASFNGHMHGECDTEGCVSWME